MKTTLPRPKKSAAPVAPPKLRGNLKPAEIKPLIMAARKAFDIQNETGNIDTGETFDTWRRSQCLAAVNQPGITACSHENYRPLLAHFKMLAGDDSGAFAAAMAGGKSSDHAAPGDTREARRHTAHLIAELLTAHAHLAETSIEDLIAEGAQEWNAERPGEPYPGPAPEWLSNIRRRKAAIDAKGKGPIGVGYLIWLVRQKTQRPDLHLGQDWQAGLADRCTANQLRQILYTLTNRISALEGLGTPKDRNKAQRSTPAKAAKSPHSPAPRF